MCVMIATLLASFPGRELEFASVDGVRASRSTPFDAAAVIAAGSEHCQSVSKRKCGRTKCKRDYFEERAIAAEAALQEAQAALLNSCGAGTIFKNGKCEANCEMMDGAPPISDSFRTADLTGGSDGHSYPASDLLGCVDSPCPLGGGDVSDSDALDGASAPISDGGRVEGGYPSGGADAWDLSCDDPPCPLDG